MFENKAFVCVVGLQLRVMIEQHLVRAYEFLSRNLVILPPASDDSLISAAS